MAYSDPPVKVQGIIERVGLVPKIMNANTYGVLLLGGVQIYAVYEDVTFQDRANALGMAQPGDTVEFEASHELVKMSSFRNHSMEARMSAEASKPA